MLQRLLVGLRSSQHPVLPVVLVVPAAFLVLQLVLQLVAPVLGQLVASSVHPPEASLEPPVAAQLGLPPSEPLEEAPLGLPGTSSELGSEQFFVHFSKADGLMKVETRFTRYTR